MSDPIDEARTDERTKIIKFMRALAIVNETESRRREARGEIDEALARATMAGAVMGVVDCLENMLHDEDRATPEQRVWIDARRARQAKGGA